MSIQTEIDRIAIGVQNAYNAVSEMGGEVPVDAGVDELGDAIRTIATADVKWWSPEMTSDDTPSPYVADGSSNEQSFGSSGFFAAFDNNETTFWANNGSTPGSISFDFGRETTVYGIRVLPRKGYPTQMFNSAVVQGSYDKKEWYDLAIVSDNKPVDGQYNYFAFSTPKAYRYYRIDDMRSSYMTDVGSSYYIAIANILFKRFVSGHLESMTFDPSLTLSEDNVLSVTEPTKSVTKEEFKAMSDEQKKGIVVVTDEEGAIGGSSGSSKEVYSAEETVIGTWIDGKPLYRKVIELIVKVDVIGVGAWSTVSDKIADFNECIKLYGQMYIPNNKAWYSAPFDGGGNYIVGIGCFVDGQIIVSIGNGAYNGIPYRFILEYTKTTD